MPSEVPVDRWEGVDVLQFVGQAYPTHALLDSSPVSMHTGDILRLKAFVYRVCTVRMDVVNHKQKFSTHGAQKQTYMLFQNEIPIDVACHRYTLNMQRAKTGTQTRGPKLINPVEEETTTVSETWPDDKNLTGSVNHTVKEEITDIAPQAF
ncbi:uncharacterized protein TNCV_3883941 [Trichonephila clavipes]|nr:uncharacterized protein TNCV_3883941 [Trichonephila clavipes]